MQKIFLKNTGERNRLNKKCCVIYKAVNLNNNHMYIGETCNLEKRKLAHLNVKKSIYFSNALKSYGMKSFEWFILNRTYNESEALELEKFWISYFKLIGMHLYNLTDGGEGISGYKFTPEQAKKIGRANTKRIWSKETLLKKQKMMKNNKLRLGIPHTKETKKKIGISVSLKNKIEFINYNDFKQILKLYNVQNGNHYKRIYKKIMKDNNVLIPRNAGMYYAKSWFDILEKEKHWKKRYLSFDKFIHLIKKYNIISCNDYKKQYKFIKNKENIIIPCRPEIVYKMFWSKIIEFAYKDK